MMKNKGGFLAMVLAVLGIVLYTTLFDTILAAFVTLASNAHLSTFIAFSVIIKIAPTVLLLGGLIGAGLVYWKGYGSLSSGGGDTAGILRMVLGALMIILFVTLFDTILTSFYTLYSADNADYFIAFQTICTILPTILFLAGIFAGVATGVGGIRSRKRRKALM
jgi:hypothetical protein